MFSKTKMILAAALVLSSGVAALANDRDGEDAGFVLPGSMDGVNPAYHPDWFAGQVAQRTKAAKALDYVAPHSKPGESFGLVTPRAKIVRPVPARSIEDNYGPEAGKE